MPEVRLVEEEMVFNQLAMGKHALNLLRQHCVLLTPLGECRAVRNNLNRSLGWCVHVVICGGQYVIDVVCCP